VKTAVLFSRVIAVLRSVCLENLGLKLISLVFSFGLFAFLHAQEDRQQRTVPVGVVLRLPPESSERELMTPIPANVHVTLRGSSRAIDELIQAGVPPVDVDLRSAEREVLNFEPSMFSMPENVDITIVDPPSIRLEWQNVITRRIPLQASITGKPAEGYVVKGEPEVDPTNVNVQGPASLVEVMQFLRLAAFDVSGLTEGVHRRRVAMDPTPTRVSALGPSSAQVAVSIARRVSEVKFPNRPIEVIGISGSYTIPRVVDITLVGAPEVVRALRPEQVVPRVQIPDEKGAHPEKHGSVAVPVTVDVAHAEVEIQPPTVTVRW
jgi:hypothetical protein